MKATNAYEKFTELRKKLTGTEIVVDDGADSGDSRQNADFSFSLRNIRTIREQAAQIDVDGIDMDAIWRACLPKCFNRNAPEDLYCHTIAYIDAVLAAIKQESNNRTPHKKQEVAQCENAKA